MGGKRQGKDEGTIIAAKPAVVDELRATLSRWPQLWAVEDSDVELGRRLTEWLEPFLLELRTVRDALFEIFKRQLENLFPYPRRVSRALTIATVWSLVIMNDD